MSYRLIESTVDRIDRMRKKYVATLQASNPSYTIEVEKSFEAAQAVAYAGEFYLADLKLMDAIKQSNPLTADSRSVSPTGQLETHGLVSIGRLPHGAVAGEYLVRLTGTGSVYAGTRFTDRRTGAVYLIKDSVTLSAGVPVDVTMVAAVGGSMYLLVPSDELSAQQGGVVSAVVLSISAVAVDGESVEEYRSAVLRGRSTVSRGGSAGDYRLWADQIPAVKQVYPYSIGETGSLVIYVEGYGSDLVASAATINAYCSLLNTVAPGSSANVRAVVPIPIAVTLTGVAELGSFTFSQLRSLIISTVTSHIESLRPFVAAVDQPDDRNDTISQGGVMTAIAAAINGKGVFSSVVVSNVIGEPMALYKLTGGEVPRVQNILFV